jgi:hypothetical protein
LKNLEQNIENVDFAASRHLEKSWNFFPCPGATWVGGLAPNQCLVECPSQVIEKHVPMDVILRDQGVTELFVQDRMSRVSTHALLRALVTQMEDLIPDVIRRSFMPSNVLIMPFTDPDDHWVLLPGGKATIANSRTRNARFVFPPDWSPRNVFSLSLVASRPQSCLQ